MCDYSLAHKASRPAKVGERLTSTKFTDTATRGFTAPNDPNTAVCVLPGTEISFAGSVVTTTRIPYDADVDGVTRIVGVPPRKEDVTATFIQVNKNIQSQHHDALEFADGSITLLTDLEPAQEATVLTLPANPETLQGKEREEAEIEQSRAAFV